MKTTQKEDKIMTNTAMEKGTLREKIRAIVTEELYDYGGSQTDDLLDLFHSQLSQIKEEIEKVIDNTLNDFDAKVLKKEIDSHMEEKGQEE